MNSPGITFKYSSLILEWLTIMTTVVILIKVLSLTSAKFIKELAVILGGIQEE